MLRLIFLILLFAVGAVFLFRNFFLGPGRFDGKERFSFIIDTATSLLLFSVSPRDRSITIVSVNPDTYLLAPYGLGTYKAANIYKLGSLQSSPQTGGQIISATAQETFGVPTEGYIRYEIDDGFTISHISTLSDWDTFKRERFGFFPTFVLMQKIITGNSTVSTNLHPMEIFALFRTLSGSTTLQVKVFDLTSYEAVSPFILPDKSKISRIDPDRLDKILEGAFAEERIQRENISVGILNASRLKGVAGTLSRIVSNMGARVVSVSNADTFIPESCYLSGTSEIISSYTVSRLVEIFGCRTNIVSNQDELTGPYTLEFLVGEGYGTY